MRSPRLVLLLLPALLFILAAAPPDPLVGLKTACEKSKDQNSLHKALQALAPPLRFELTEDFTLTPMRPDEHRYTLRFRQPIPAERLVAAMGWTRAYAVSSDVHQETWGIVLWKSDVAEDGNFSGPRIGIQDPHVGAWAFMPSLADRPAGPLPKLAAGASPAYDLTAYSAQVTTVEIEPWSPDRQ